MRIRTLLTDAGLLASLVSAAEHRVSSPDGKLAHIVSDDAGLRYRVELDGKPLFADSVVGPDFADGTTLGPAAKITGTKKASRKTTLDNAAHRSRRRLRRRAEPDGPGPLNAAPIPFRVRPTLTPMNTLIRISLSLLSMAMLAANSIAAPSVEPYILTPPAPASPRINGASVFGVRPGSPFLFTIAATGDRPMTFSAQNLPEGLKLDPATGRITGALAMKGEHIVMLGAKNSLGAAEKKFRIVCGEQIALTPPMGWNSWNCFAHEVSADRVKAAADVLVKSGLANHGWTYVNIDDFWQNNRDSKDPTLQGPIRDTNGFIVPNARFPDMKGLADYVHGLGLKIGLYSSPGPWTCGGCAGSYGYERQDAETYAKWGFDYFKYDWCSYGGIADGKAATDKSISSWDAGEKGKSDVEVAAHPFRLMGKILREQKRDIVFSVCQYGMSEVWKWGASVDGNCWRTTYDITDTWESMSSIGFDQQDRAAPFAKPGNWNDPDMLVVGHVGWGNPKPTRLTPDEQYTHMSLWCLLASPLLLGCDLEKLDDFTLSLLTNDEVIAVDQDPLGKQATCVIKDGDLRVYARELEDGSRAVGFFNLGVKPMELSFKDFSKLGLAGRQTPRDLWRQKNLAAVDTAMDSLPLTIPAHGVVLCKFTTVK